MTPDQTQLIRDALPVVGTLLGAAVGAVGGGVGTWLQMRAESRRQSHRLALELGLQEGRASLEHARASGQHMQVYPPAAFIHLYVELLKLMEHDDMSPAALKAALDRSSSLAGVFEQFSKEIQAPTKRNL
jgi:hypothetical protein